MTKRAQFTEAELRRAAKVALQLGLGVRISMAKDGTQMIDLTPTAAVDSAAQPQAKEADTRTPNMW